MGGACERDMSLRGNEYKSFTHEEMVILPSIEKWCRMNCFNGIKIVLFVESTVRFDMDEDYRITHASI